MIRELDLDKFDNFHFEMDLDNISYFTAMRSIALYLIDVYIMQPEIIYNNSFTKDEIIEHFIKSIHLIQSKELSTDLKFNIKINVSKDREMIYLDKWIKFDGIDNNKIMLPNLYFRTLTNGQSIHAKGSLSFGNIKRMKSYLYQAVSNFGMKHETKKGKIYVTIQMLETFGPKELFKAIINKWLLIIGEIRTSIDNMVYTEDSDVDIYTLMPLVNEINKSNSKSKSKPICMARDIPFKHVTEFIFDGNKKTLLEALDTYENNVKKIDKIISEFK